MITFITGGKGGGKSLNMIKYVNENPDFDQLNVYYLNLELLPKSDEIFKKNWQLTTQEEFLNWFNFYPAGSVIVVDEIQDFMPIRSKTSRPPEFVKQLAFTRKKGIHIVCNSQYPMQVDIDLRRQSTEHIHVELTAFGRGRAYYWRTYKTDPNDYFARKEAVETKIYKLDKKYYNTYKSADIHITTHRPPKKLYYVFALFAACAVYGVYVVSRIIDRGQPKDLAPKSTEQKTSVLDSVTNLIPGPSNRQYDEFGSSASLDYLIARTPVYQGFPDSAPLYNNDEQKNSVIPILAGCQLIDMQCSCNDQYGSIVTMSHQMCLSYIRSSLIFTSHKKHDDYDPSYSFSDSDSGANTSHGQKQNIPK